MGSGVHRERLATQKWNEFEAMTHTRAHLNSEARALVKENEY